MYIVFCLCTSLIIIGNLSFIDMLLIFAELWYFHSTQHFQSAQLILSIAVYKHLPSISWLALMLLVKVVKKGNSISWSQWQHGALINEWYYNYNAWHFQPGSTKHTNPKDKCSDRADMAKWRLQFTIATWHPAYYWWIFIPWSAEV